MKTLLAVALVAIFLSGCAEIVAVDDIKMLGMTCSAREVRTSGLMTLGAMACMKPDGTITNLVGGAGKPWAEVPAQALGMATTVGSAIAVNQALKGLKTGADIIVNTAP